MMIRILFTIVAGVERGWPNGADSSNPLQDKWRKGSTSEKRGKPDRKRIHLYPGAVVLILVPSCANLNATTWVIGRAVAHGDKQRHIQWKFE